VNVTQITTCKLMVHVCYLHHAMLSLVIQPTKNVVVQLLVAHAQVVIP